MSTSKAIHEYKSGRAHFDPLDSTHSGEYFDTADFVEQFLKINKKTDFKTFGKGGF